MNPTKKLLEIKHEFNKVMEYKVSLQNSTSK